MAITVQFSFGQENRVSETFGPFEYVEVTYNGLYTEEKQRELAYLSATEGLWKTEDGQTWSDFTITTAE